MNKKMYQKPDMTVYKLNSSRLLTASKDAVYIPRVNEDMNELT